MKESNKTKKGGQKPSPPKKQEKHVIFIRDLSPNQKEVLDAYKTEISEKTASKAMLRVLEEYPLQKKRIEELTQETYKLLREKEALEDDIAEFKTKIRKFNEAKQVLQLSEKELTALIK